MNTTNSTTQFVCDSLLTKGADNATIFKAQSLRICPDYWTVYVYTAMLFLTLLVFAVVTIILICIRRNHEPIKSKSPFLAIASITMQVSFLLILLFRFVVGRTIFPCSIYTWLLVNGGGFLALPYVVRLYRLLLVSRMNQLKLRYSKIERLSIRLDLSKDVPLDIPTQTTSPTSLDETVNLPTVVNELQDTTAVPGEYFSSDSHKQLTKQIRCLKFFVSPPILLLPVAASLLILTGIWFLIGSLELVTNSTVLIESGFSIDITQGCVISFGGVVMLGIEIVVFVAVILFLCLLNIKTRDTFCIKYEIILMAAVYAIIGGIFVILGFPRIIADFLDYIIPYGTILVIPPLTEAFVSGCIPVFISLKPKASAKYSKAEAKEEESLELQNLKIILLNPSMRANFLTYAKRSFAPEYILCWQEIVKFQMAKTNKKRMDILHHIIMTFLETGSPLELNMPLEDRSLFIALHQPNNSLLDTALNDLQKKCEFNMIDLFSRYNSLSNVKQFLRTQQHSK